MIATARRLMRLWLMHRALDLVTRCAVLSGDVAMMSAANDANFALCEFACREVAGL